jgi:hypothetical protein
MTDRKGMGINPTFPSGPVLVWAFKLNRRRRHFVKVFMTAVWFVLVGQWFSYGLQPNHLFALSGA